MAVFDDQEFTALVASVESRMRITGTKGALPAGFVEIDWPGVAVVVGRWPPSTPVTFELQQHDWWKIGDVLAEAEIVLAASSPGPLVARLGEAREVLRDIATHASDATAEVEEGPPVESPHGGSHHGSSADDVSDTSIVGKWPPEA